MDSLVLTGLRIGVLVLLWLLILVALRAMRKDTAVVSGAQSNKRPRGKATSTPRKAAPAQRITIVEGPLQGSYMEISSVGEVVMGRSPDCDFVLGDDFASARHARLFRRGSDWFVEDLDSRNGTFVAGTRIDQPERVDTGTSIRVGRTTVRLVP
ncbi:FHA domain-containing protein FhaB/FipA [Corynebacterium lowii]|uniref:FHA domain-containing protein FhaB n=1 Tax=Corynebacterium lowii TaxID=1544413 RepID=A0A0Q0UFY9_9CORY|nr:FHA domain-containing protein [Corynebacterium lowii]KQB87086.1 FHA domain-containing protein FhaB [Corynebacterium lowii]MDP9852330.1 pSer/pThr/pTyr-binding forkhead associated (FHA) protein [Corynebacterium lowii]